MVKRGKLPFTNGNIVNLFIASELDTWSRALITKFAPSSSLFGAVKLGKNSDPNKYRYKGSDIAINAHHNFHCTLVKGVKMLLFFV